MRCFWFDRTRALLINLLYGPGHDLLLRVDAVNLLRHGERSSMRTRATSTFACGLIGSAQQDPLQLIRDWQRRFRTQKNMNIFCRPGLDDFALVGRAWWVFEPPRFLALTDAFVGGLNRAGFGSTAERPSEVGASGWRADAACLSRSFRRIRVS